MTGRELDNDLEVRLVLYERLVERTAPPPDNRCRCTCDRCGYGPQYIGRDYQDDAA